MTIRAFTTDLLSGRKLCHELPLQVESYSEGLNNAGTASGILALDSGADIDRLAAPRRTALWLDQDGELVWGGIIWAEIPDIGARTTRIAAAGHLSYLARREIRQSMAFQDTDQLDIARALVDFVQGTAVGNIGLRVDRTVTSGVRRDRTYPGSEAKPVSEALRQLAEVDDGFDYAASAGYDETGRPAVWLRFGHPHLAARNDRALFAYTGDPGHPGNLLDYTWPRDGTSSPNAVAVAGAGEGSAMLRGQAADAGELDAGYPLLEWTSGEHKDVIVTATLTAHAREYLRVLRGDRTVPTATVGPAGPALSSYRPGDICRFQLSSARHRPPRPGVPALDVWLRITSRTVKPASAGQALQVDLALDRVEL